jgi:hypothetical protein
MRHLILRDVDARRGDSAVCAQLPRGSRARDRRLRCQEASHRAHALAAHAAIPSDDRQMGRWLFYQVRIFEWQCTSGVRRSSTISSTVPADLACEARDATRPCGPSYDDRARAAASYCACALVRRAAGVAARARVAGREVGKGQRALRHPCRFSARNADALLCCRAGFETAQWAPRGLHDVPVHKMPALRYLRQALHSLVLC